MKIARGTGGHELEDKLSFGCALRPLVFNLLDGKRARDCSARVVALLSVLASSMHDRERQPRLVLVFPLLVRVAGLADLDCFEEQDLRDPLASVNLGRQ